MNFRLFFMLAAVALTLDADVVVLRDGSSYTGQLQMETTGATIAFTGDNGVGFTFPIRDIQLLSFSERKHSHLRSGKTYTGHYSGQSTLHLAGAEGISYDFPVKDVASIVFLEVPRR